MSTVPYSLLHVNIADALLSCCWTWSCSRLALSLHLLLGLSVLWVSVAVWSQSLCLLNLSSGVSMAVCCWWLPLSLSLHLLNMASLSSGVSMAVCCWWLVLSASCQSGSSMLNSLFCSPPSFQACLSLFRSLTDYQLFVCSLLALSFSPMLKPDFPPFSCFSVTYRSTIINQLEKVASCNIE